MKTLKFEPYPNEYRRTLQLRGGGQAVVYYSWFGDRIVHDDGTWSPAEFTYVDDAGEGLPVYVIECSHDDNDRPFVDAVHVLRWGGREIRSADVQRLRSLEDVIADAWTAISHTTGPREDGRPRDDVTDPDKLRRKLRGLRSTRPHKITDEFLTRVAKVYRANVDSGAPVQAVADKFSVADSTAFRYVNLARKAGKLEPRA